MPMGLDVACYSQLKLVSTCSSWRSVLPNLVNFCLQTIGTVQLTAEFVCVDLTVLHQGLLLFEALTILFCKSKFDYLCWLSFFCNFFYFYRVTCSVFVGLLKHKHQRFSFMTLLLLQFLRDIIFIIIVC